MRDVLRDSRGERRLAPLTGVQVLEFGGLGPAPQAALQLADLGAQVTTILPPDAPGSVGSAPHRSRTIERINLRSEDGHARAMQLVGSHDVLLEGFRPGTMERLRLGPTDCVSSNHDLIYARLTGWGQEGPFSALAGHDINYIGLTGALRAITDLAGRPVPPLNLVGDAGGGTMFVVVGILSALLHREQTGEGAVIDAAIVDGTLQLSNLVWQLLNRQKWDPDVRSNQFDGGAPYYDVYPCSDGEFMAVGAIEQRFYEEFLLVLGMRPEDLPDREDRAEWPRLRELIAARIATRSRSEWASLAFGRDACFTPVLSWGEVGDHPHMRARHSLQHGLPAAAPRLFELVAEEHAKAPGARNKDI